ncbi:TspO/MBR family protein [Legionella hackeliae]|nr:TspO/MBR family protein [Legionella hackeliae]
MTKNNIYPWYENLIKSNLTPPPLVFSIVWPILYLLLAIPGFLLWVNYRQGRLRLAFYVYWIQMILNWVWTPLFFKFHLIELSFYVLLLLALLTLVIIYLARNRLKAVSWILFPYFIWLLFAIYLNGTIVVLN